MTYLYKFQLSDFKIAASEPNNGTATPLPRLPNQQFRYIYTKRCLRWKISYFIKVIYIPMHIVYFCFSFQPVCPKVGF